MSFMFINDNPICNGIEPILSNGTACYWIHTLTSQYYPQVHCQHTTPESTVCIDTCAINCTVEILGLHGHCESLYFPPFGIVSYAAVCDNGYTGTPPNCVPHACTKNSDCGHGRYDNGHKLAPDYSISCVDGICLCNPTFAWNSSIYAPAAGQACFCDPNQSEALLVNNTTPSNPISVCEQKGRCFVASDCLNVVSNINTVECQQYGINIFLPTDLQTCVCKTQNGWQGLPGTDCICPEGNFEVSHHINGVKQDYCLAPGQCVTDKDCKIQGLRHKQCSECDTGIIGVCQ